MTSDTDASQSEHEVATLPAAVPAGVLGQQFGAEYNLPLRWREGADLSELTTYLEILSGWIDVTVVDGSSPEEFERHRRAWSGLVTHTGPAPWPGRNGKVRNVVTGVRRAMCPLVVIADDDVRYTADSLVQVLTALADADLVVPQNVFSSWPWHARWDTGRQLANRAFGGDYPGTMAGRRRFMVDGYDGDVLFENLELMRTVAARGGTVRRRNDVFVDRVPPTAAHFWSQRIRQAYDSFAQPPRLLLEASLLPILLVASRRPHLLLSLAAGAVILGEAGRRRDGGAPCHGRVVDPRLGGGARHRYLACDPCPRSRWYPVCRWTARTGGFTQTLCHAGRPGWGVVCRRGRYRHHPELVLMSLTSSRWARARYADGNVGDTPVLHEPQPGDEPER